MQTAHRSAFAIRGGGIDPNRKTPVADARNIVKVIMMLPGEQAAALASALVKSESDLPRIRRIRLPLAR